MNDWKRDLLTNHVSLITKGTTPTSIGKDFQESGINFIKAESITDAGKFIPEAFAFIDEATHLILKRSQLQQGDILFSIAGVLGRVAVVPFEVLPANTNQAIALIRLSSNSEIENDFLKHLLNSEFVKEQIRRINVQAAQANFSLADINRLHIQFPKSEGVQTKIAKILSTADAVIEKTQTAIAKYKAIKQGMLQDLFTRGIDIQTGKLRPRYEDAPELYKESKLGWIPREWKEDVLGNIISVSSGVGLTQEYVKPGIHLIYGGNGVNGLHSEYLFEEEKLIIGRVGEYCGNAYITKPFSWVTDNALIVTPLKKPFLLEFWVYYINYLDLNSRAFVGAQPVITGGLVNKEVVVEIPHDEQQKIAERLKAIDNKLQTEKAYLQKMQSLKKGLMEDLLSGRKQVKVEEFNNAISNE